MGGVAAIALGSVGQQAVPAILELLKDKSSPNVISRAAEAVAVIGPEAKAAVPLLTQALKMDNGVQGRSIIKALARIGPAAKPAIPAMIDYFGEYIQSKEFLAAKKLEKSEGGSVFGSGSLVVTLVEALLKIDPEIKGILPEGVLLAGGARSASDLNLRATPTAWQQAHDALKKNYQKQ